MRSPSLGRGGLLGINGVILLLAEIKNNGSWSGCCDVNFSNGNCSVNVVVLIFSPAFSWSFGENRRRRVQHPPRAGTQASPWCCDQSARRGFSGPVPIRQRGHAQSRSQVCWWRQIRLWDHGSRLAPRGLRTDARTGT